MKETQTEKTVVPVFYAVDDNYLPYLIVSLTSLKRNANKNCQYLIHVLTAGTSEKMQRDLAECEEENVRIQCVNVSDKMEEVKNSLHLRDYYTGATYYRIFIASMFPQYDKAVYLDSDTVLLGDVGELYQTELGDNLVGAIPDGAVAAVPEFRAYTKGVLGIDAEKYFNAGVLLMNLAQFRKEGFYKKFCSLLGQYQFKVAQDQDYLNVICRDKVSYIGMEWNRMPIGGKEDGLPKLIHYNLTMKPWHYEDILFQEFFWEYAKTTKDYERILQELKEYTQDKKDADAATEKQLIALCMKEVDRDDNYRKRFM